MKEKSLVTLIKLVLLQSHSALNSPLLFHVYYSILLRFSHEPYERWPQLSPNTREKTKVHSSHCLTSVTLIMTKSELEYMCLISRFQDPFSGDHDVLESQRILMMILS